MKKILLAVLFILCTSPAFAQTLAQSGIITVNNVTSGTSGTFTSNVGDVLFVTVADNNATAVVSDSKTNSWNVVGSANAVGVVTGKRFYTVVSNAGSSHTITVTFTGNANSTPIWSRITGASGTPLDATASTQGNSSTSPYSLASGTMAQANNLIIADIFCDGAVGNYTAGGSFSLFQQQTNDSLFWTQAAASLGVTATTAQTASWTISGSIGGGAGLFVTVFKATGGGGGGLVVNPISGRGGSAAQPIVQ